MKLILAGCEYAGTTTLANAINDWTEQVMGNRIRNIHDHFKIPQTIGHSDPDYANEEEQRQYLALSPKIMETAQRHNLYYHSPSESSSNEDRLVIGHHIDEAVYAPLYFGYGRTGENGDREVIAWQIEHKIKKFEPELVLILVKASPEVIARRMKEGAHPNAVVQEKDIELLRRFQRRTSNWYCAASRRSSAGRGSETSSSWIPQPRRWTRPLRSSRQRWSRTSRGTIRSGYCPTTRPRRNRPRKPPPSSSP